MITIADDRLRVQFNRFDGEAYATFLKVKRLPEYDITFDPEAFDWTITAPARFAPLLGMDIPRPQRDLPLAPFLFDDQAAIIRMALDAKRFACWSGCGMGKTLIFLEWARQVAHRTDGRVLIVSPREIIAQTIEESRRFYGDGLDILFLDSRAAMKDWCAGRLIDVEGREVENKIAITNYEKFNHKTPADQIVNQCRHLAGVVLDESSRLKAGGGKQKWAIIKSCRGIEYKLSCTATPAPNEIMEFASQASFLEKMRTENDIIWTYFRRDEKTHRWTVKRHARKAFFEFMAGWSIYLQDPRRYGWRKNVAFPPDPVIIRHDVPMTDDQRAFVLEHNAAMIPAGKANETPSMFADEGNAITVGRFSQAAKGFVYSTDHAGRRIVRPVASHKPAKVAEIIREDVEAGLQVLVWTVYDAESNIIAETLGSSVPFDLLTGKVPHKKRRAMIERFRAGHSRVLISRPSMLGYGMNFQHCGSMVFSGWTFSFESFYQAVRRAWRFGQTRSVRVHIPVVTELEGQMLDAIGRKDRQHEEAVREMEENYIRAIKALRGSE